MDTSYEHHSSADADLGKTKEVTVSCEISQDQWDRLRAVYSEMPEGQLVRECLLQTLYLRETVRNGMALELTEGTKRIWVHRPEEIQACSR